MKPWIVVVLTLALVGGCGALDNESSDAPIGAVTVKSTIEGGTLFVDALERGPLRDGMEVQLTPGPHVLEARMHDRVVARLPVEAQSARIFEVRLEATAPVSPLPEPNEVPVEAPVEAPVDTPSPSLRAPGVVGALSLDAVRDVLEAHRGELDACWAAAADASDRPRPDTLSLDLELHVDASGAVTRATVASEQDGLTRCLTASAGRWRFSASRGASVITLPLTFTAAHGLAPSAPSAPVAGAADQPDRADVMAAMRTVTGPVQACSDGSHGLVVVRFSFRGDTGASDSVTSTCSMSRSVCDCVLEAVRPARVPPFGRESFSVSYPFRL